MRQRIANTQSKTDDDISDEAAGAARKQLADESKARKDAEEEAARAQAARPDVSVQASPPQPKERMPAVWSLCAVALVHLKASPVFAGVIPSKIFEAMGMGRPVLLAAPEGEASRIVEGDGAGLCIPPEDPAALNDLWDKHVSGGG